VHPARRNLFAAARVPAGDGQRWRWRSALSVVSSRPPSEPGGSQQRDREVMRSGRIGHVFVLAGEIEQLRTQLRVRFRFRDRSEVGGAFAINCSSTRFGGGLSVCCRRPRFCACHF
jgi:hypothetical protein